MRLGRGSLVLVLATTSATPSPVSFASVKRRLDNVAAASSVEDAAAAAAAASAALGEGGIDIGAGGRLLPPSIFTHRKRKLDTPCDAAFLGCLPNEACLDCFETLGDEDIDWASVSPATPCSDVVEMLNGAGHCSSLVTNAEGKNAFCETFNSCVIWDDDADDDEYDDWGVVCSDLKKCEWDGMHKNFLGDGICHRTGCYNTEVCEWDHGDCCEDTCVSTSFNDCGVDDYQCKDPKSPSCEHSLNAKCKPDETPAPKPSPTCKGEEKLYTLNQFDSWGDGWDTTEMTLKDSGEKELYKGGLEEGYEGSEILCLEKGCYSVSLSEGLWGNEVSWEVRPADGGPNLAFGGAPMDCNFPLGGNECENTCKGKEADNSEADLSDCTNTKCVIQLKSCQDDKDCAACLVKDSPSYCFTNDNYNALVDCAICKCTDEVPEYCSEKGPGGQSSTPKPAADGTTKPKNTCNAQDTLLGSSAVLSYSKCSDIDGVAAMISDWNEDHFGALDTFEWCAHTYKNTNNHGGQKAMDCMKLLVEIVNGDTKDPEYVTSIATNLYKTPQAICDCSSEANKDCPACDSFARFKTLLSETLDACNALDEIDCPAWEEFSRPCKENMISEFTSLDFSQKAQCDFAESGCKDQEGKDVGPFPSFRRLDCGKEISKVSWDFYNEYAKGCLKNEPDTTPTPAPQPDPTPSGPQPGPDPSPSGPNPQPSPAPVEPKPSDPSSPTPYVPPPDGPSSASSAATASGGGKSKRVFFWIFVVGGLCGGAYIVYKKRRNSSFNFVRYHRYHRQPQDEDGLGQELFGGASTGSFEPVSVPPQQTSV